MNEKVVTIPMIATSDYTNTSRVIHSGPCIVKAVHVAGENEDTAGSCDVYDGVNTSGTLKAHLESGTGSSYTWRPGDGTDFDFGIYIDLIHSMVTVTYIPESRKAFI